MLARCTLLAMAVCAGCYRPALEDACTVRCDDGVCPSHLSCGSTDQLCHAPGAVDCSLRTDAAIEPVDVSTDALSLCYGGNGLLPSFCVDALSPGVLDMNGTFDTTTGCATSTLGAEICVIAAEELHVPSALTLKGGRPIVLIGARAVQITGDIDLAGHSALTRSMAGGDVATCTGQTAQVDTTGRGGGGGGGGAFQGGGGMGGMGGMSDGAAGAVVSPGIAEASGFRGGCQGGAGGSSGSTAVIVGMPGGHSGGALYVISAGTITVGGQIDASGGGSEAAPATTGGGGGGSGGMIVLDGASIEVLASGRIFALGGGGGSGGGGSTTGKPGTFATDPAVPAPQIGGVNGSGNGGAGGSRAVPDGQPGSPATTSLRGGGGGGGGVGFIYVKPLAGFPTADNVVAPAPRAIP